MERTQSTTEAPEPPDDLALWELHAWCLGAVQPPGPVVRRGENGRLLHAARTGLDRHAIDETRMAELEHMHLLERSGDEIRTIFPIIGPQAAAPLRRHARNLAEKLLPSLLDPATRIRDHLTSQGLSGHTFAIIFGHALDGLMWSFLAAHGAIPDTRLTPDRPFWNGTFWAIWPPRENPAGVNEARFPGMTLVMVWTPRTEERLKAFARQPGLEAAFRSIAAGAATTFSQGVGGLPRIPVLRPGDPLDLQSQALARPVADALLSAPLPAIERARGQHDARIILGHELIWDLADLLQVNGLIARSASWNPASNIFLRIESDWTQPRERSIIGT